MTEVWRPTEQKLTQRDLHDLLGLPRVIAESRCEKAGQPYRVVLWQFKRITLDSVANCIDLVIHPDTGRVGAVHASDSKWWEEA